MPGAARRRQRLGHRRRGVERDDPRPRRHHVGGRPLVEREDALEQLAVGRVELVARRRVGDEAPQLLEARRAGVARGRRAAEHAHERVRGGVEHAHERPEEAVEDLQRQRADRRDARRRADREALGRLLPDRDVQPGHDQQGEHRADDRARVREAAEERLDQVCDRRLAERAERQRGDRDAQLAGREVLVEPLRLPAHDGAGPAAWQLLLGAERDQGELGSHEEAVDQHENCDRNEGRACQCAR